MRCDAPPIAPVPGGWQTPCGPPPAQERGASIEGLPPLKPKRSAPPCTELFRREGNTHTPPSLPVRSPADGPRLMIAPAPKHVLSSKSRVNAALDETSKKTIRGLHTNFCLSRLLSAGGMPAALGRAVLPQPRRVRIVTSMHCVRMAAGLV